MRVLRTDTEDLILEIVNDDYKEHAILSHRWYADGEKITFADVCDRQDVTAKSGLKKLQDFRRKAREDGFQHVWLDTCCIDKSSSEELTESINSMFRWYQNARICYVYLHDMPAGVSQNHDSVPTSTQESDEADIATTRMIAEAGRLSDHPTSPCTDGTETYSPSVNGFNAAGHSKRCSHLRMYASMMANGRSWIHSMAWRKT